ncbi:hypothetical protein chiPu_0031212, partial [Chiloscyllium punctatum]|nr:hypothetical protein [Chiloscyllium punctatum]
MALRARGSPHCVGSARRRPTSASLAASEPRGWSSGSGRTPALSRGDRRH